MSQIPGTNVSKGIVPQDTADTFETHDEQYGKGGYRTVATIADRDAISSARRSVGMRVKVLDDDGTGVTGRDFILGGNLSNTGWSGLPTAAELRDRATQTGTQSADTITDGSTKVAMLLSERTSLGRVTRLDPIKYARSGWLTAVVGAGNKIISGTRVVPLPIVSSALNAGGTAVTYLNAIKYARSGWLRASVGDGNKIISGVRANPVAAPVIANAINAAGQMINYLNPVKYARSGWAKASVGDGNKIISGTRSVPVALPSSSPAIDTIYELLEIADTSAKLQTFAASRSTGRLTQLSPAGSNNSPRDLLSDGWATYKSDRANGAPGGLYARQIVGNSFSPEIPVFPKHAIIGVGDSLTYSSGVAANSYWKQLGDLLGWSSLGFGINGQTAQQIAARWGARPMFLTLAGNTLTASGQVLATAISEDPITGQLGVAIHGRLGPNGPYATLVRTGDGSAGQPYGLTQDTGGSDTAIVPGTRFYPDGASINNSQSSITPYPRDSVAIIWAVRNSYHLTDSILENLDLIDKSLSPLFKRRLFPLCIYGDADSSNGFVAEVIGSPTRAVVDYTNAAIKARYPDNWVDFTPALLAAGDNSAGDNADIASGLTPRSLRKKADNSIDFLHLNGAGNLVAARDVLLPNIQQRNWTL